MKLIYVGDPMCSWCYGFGAPLDAALAEHPELPIALLLGGLRPYTAGPMPAARKAKIGGHWARVRERSGAAFAPFATHPVLSREDFIYDTEPACRAVVTARSIDQARVLPLFHAIQAAFYREGRDVTRSPVLVDIAAENGLDRAAFAAAIDSGAMRAATRRDFETASSWGIQGYPALLLERDGRLSSVTHGFVPCAALRIRLAQALTSGGA
ncbi:MAG: disulfide bond formation protein DsbA [Rhodocyclales bacterium CG17_big_fil_post_rev_8_21_14_2_50_68_7]|nr:MAG: disulfide bond formation protein DsbA [Rhodocyclales bacterium CG17_big_fil_post_rev_8_21_14_2_50_68_7]